MTGLGRRARVGGVPVAGTEIRVRNETRNEVYVVRNGLSTRQVDMRLVGGLIPWLREQYRVGRAPDDRD